jgi:hypothetical protein
MPIDVVDSLYENIRRDETDVEEIARHIGWKPSSVAKIKCHLFIQEHWLDLYESLGVPATSARFDADEVIARAWIRLKGGVFTAIDLHCFATRLRRPGTCGSTVRAIAEPIRPLSVGFRHRLPCGVEPCGSPRSANSKS